MSAETPLIVSDTAQPFSPKHVQEIHVDPLQVDYKLGGSFLPNTHLVPEWRGLRVPTDHHHISRAMKRVQGKRLQELGGEVKGGEKSNAHMFYSGALRKNES